MNFSQEYKLRQNAFEEMLPALLPQGYPSPLGDAVRYAVTSGGKRLRPILLCESARLFCDPLPQSAAQAAFAIEALHTYSLVHDDLPCMDNDDFRRGKPTCHKQFGEANALLAGDALLNLAYETLFSLALSDPRGAEAGLILARAASGSGLIGGQVVDLSPALDEKSIDYVYDNKTGALIVAALEMGAVLGGASQTARQSIVRFGKLFGFCFQLQDDLLDKDTDADKKTYLKLFGEQATRELLQRKTQEAAECLQEFDNAAFLIALAQHFMERTH